MTSFKNIEIGASFKFNGVWFEKRGLFSALNDEREEVFFQANDQVQAA